MFALLFVAAVGLGPFAGVLGIGLHSAGSLAKLWSEAIETIEAGPLEAVAMTGAGRLKIVFHALLPDVLPALLSTASISGSSTSGPRPCSAWSAPAASPGSQEQRRPAGFRQRRDHHPDHSRDGDGDRPAERVAAPEADLTPADPNPHEPPQEAPAIEVRRLGKRYDGKPVLDELSFTVARGEVVVLLGPSGAGKTTLFRCLTPAGRGRRGRNPSARPGDPGAARRRAASRAAAMSGWCSSSII
ncbi:MAG: ATP-binding cassette domain-containing protein [Pseudomonadota bacterium]